MSRWIPDRSLQLWAPQRLLEGFIILVPDGFEVPWLRWLIIEILKVPDKSATEVAPIVDAVPR
jgi:hypothetical protein